MGLSLRSHFEIPQTDSTYLRKCNEREQALYSGLYEHESVRPEHHPKYGYVSVNCRIQPPWEPQTGEACLILKDHVRYVPESCVAPFKSNVCSLMRTKGTQRMLRCLCAEVFSCNG